MTNNTYDEFEQENLDTLDEEARPASTQARGSMTDNLSEAWRTRPLFKLFVIMASVVAAIIVSLSLASGPAPEMSKLVKAPDLNEAPGGKSSPYFIDQNKMAANQRAEEAMQQGGSAIPTPVGQNVDIGDLTNDKKADPLSEFRAETERLKQELKQEQQQSQQQIQVIQQQIQQPQPFDDTLAQAMQRQMQQLMESWSPRNAKFVTGTGSKEASAVVEGAKQADAGAVKTDANSKIIVSAGTVSYGQLITEANSDVPGPILAQILSGPFAGGKAVGAFQTQRTHLVMSFSIVHHKGKDYPVQILALNPNTTLGGMASEVDQRYFDRVVLPAAASFMQAFGSAIGEGDSSTTISNNAVIVDHAKRGVEDGVYSGIGQVGQTLGQFLQERASQIKPLIRVASGTPIGMFFLSSARDSDANNQELLNGRQFLEGNGTVAGQGAYQAGYQQGAQTYNNPYQNIYGSGYNSTTGTSTAYRPSGTYSTTTGYGATTNQSPYATSYYGR